MIVDTLTTSWFQSHYAGIDWTASHPVGAVFFNRTPAFNEVTETAFSGYQSISDITGRVEWVETQAVTTPEPGTIYARQFISGTIQGLQFVDGSAAPASVDGSVPTGWVFTSATTESVQEAITAVAFYLIGTVSGVVNPILFATTQGIGENTIVHDDAIYGQFQNFAVTGGKTRVLTADPAATPPSFTATHLLMKPALPVWESAHAQHLWLEPQRTNLIVNPSFEAATLTGWRYYAAAASRVTGGVDTTRPNCAHFIAAAGPWVILESNYFPTPGPWMSISVTASVYSSSGSPANLSFGLVKFDPSYTQAQIYCSDEYPQARIISVARFSGLVIYTTDAPHGYYIGEQVVIENLDPAFDGNFMIFDVPSDTQFVVAIAGADLPSATATGVATAVQTLRAQGGTAISGFRTYQGLVQVPNDTPEMCFRLEVLGAAEVWIDNVLVDPHESQYAYFDGNSVDTIPLDYRWMGGRENNHFSCWYNNYLNTHNRLFSDWDQNEQIFKAGLVEEWTPTGAAVIDHWDAVTSFTPLNWAGDAYYPVAEVSGTTISTLTSRMDFQGRSAPT